MTFLMIHCGEWDLTLTLELAADLPVQGLLVALNGQEHVGPLLQAPLKNGRVVCSATPSEKASPTAWISTPSRSRLDSSSYCFAEACG